MQTQTNSTPKHGIATAHGYGIKIRVYRRHLVIEDGIGRDDAAAATTAPASYAASSSWVAPATSPWRRSAGSTTSERRSFTSTPTDGC